MKTRSLKSRALQLLAQRDQSRLELQRKLLRQLRRAAALAVTQAAGDDPCKADADVDARADLDERSAAEVEALLDWLAIHGFLSDDRFVESRVHARAPRFGNLRIKSELAQHGVVLPASVVAELAETELARAGAVRERRFREPPGDAAGRAAQARFLAGRGFSPEVIHRLLRHSRA